ncbi:MAG: hypothetical protein M1812_003543 [Candelaria pacifica]|nr:MAG: hypothetical protein M1812_003543 [Candelaria pacifica]
MVTNSQTQSEIPQDDNDWEAEEGLPQMEDQFIQKYMQGRSALIAQENKQRSDHVFRQMLSPMAAEADAIVAQIREEEAQTLWTHASEDQLVEPEDDPIWPGMMFAQSKDRMEKSRLFKIVRRLPKGALLHAHFDAMIDVGWLLEKALATEGMSIQSSEALCTPRALDTGVIRFVYSKLPSETSASIWTPDYTASTAIPLALAAKSFPDGGRFGFLAWLKGRCTITAEESLNHQHGVNAVWRKFIDTFPIIGSMLFYEPIYRAAIHHMCKQLLEDGIRWVDLRAAFTFQYRREYSEAADEGYEEMIRVLGEEVERFKATDEGTRFWGVRMIWTTLRSFDKRNIVDIKKAHPNLIAGFDVVGQEDKGRPLKDLTPELFWFRKRCVEEGVEIPFFFHAGECLGDGDETDSNLFDAILLGSRRIGHGFSLYKHPLLIEMIKEKRILVESCPVSNEVLRLTGSIKSHPLPALLSRGVPTALCNDDPAILGQGSAGLTHDFWQALQGWENLGLAGLGALAENSLRYAAWTDQKNRDWVKDVKDGAFGDGVRALRMKEWSVEWERFCQWIVEEYNLDNQSGMDE